MAMSSKPDDLPPWLIPLHLVGLCTAAGLCSFRTERPCSLGTPGRRSPREGKKRGRGKKRKTQTSVSGESTRSLFLLQAWSPSVGAEIVFQAHCWFLSLHRPLLGGARCAAQVFQTAVGERPGGVPGGGLGAALGVAGRWRRGTTFTGRRTAVDKCVVRDWCLFATFISLPTPFTHPGGDGVPPAVPPAHLRVLGWCCGMAR